MPQICAAICGHDWKSKLTSFLILFLPTAVMVGFIIWAVYESTANNTTAIIELGDTRCLIKTTYTNLVKWLELENTNATNVLSVSGGSRIMAIIAKTNGEDCDDVFSV